MLTRWTVSFNLRQAPARRRTRQAGGCLNTPSLNLGSWVVQQNAVSGIQKNVKNHDETPSVIFLGQVKGQVTRAQILPFSIFFCKSAHN